MSKKNMSWDKRVQRVLSNHATIVKKARRKYGSGGINFLSLTGRERYIIRNNVGYSKMLGG